MNAHHTLRPDFHLVVIPHNLEHWNIPEYLPYIERIETVWFFDKNVHVYCCEVTPSYELWPLETRVIFKDSFDHDVDEELRDKIESDVSYWSCDEVEYHHVRALDHMLSKPGTQQYSIGDHNKGCSYEDSSYEEQRVEALEYYQAGSFV